MDAFAHHWGKEIGWENPPWAVIPQFLRKVQEDQATIVAILPRWIGRPWWPRFRALVTISDTWLSPWLFALACLAHPVRAYFARRLEGQCPPCRMSQVPQEFVQQIRTEMIQIAKQCILEAAHIQTQGQGGSQPITLDEDGRTQAQGDNEQV